MTSVPILGYIDGSGATSRNGYYLSSCLTVLGAASLFLLTVQSRHLEKQDEAVNYNTIDSKIKDHVSQPPVCTCPMDLPSTPPPAPQVNKIPLYATMDHGLSFATSMDNIYIDPRRGAEFLTCISEEGLLDNIDDFLMDYDFPGKDDPKESSVVGNAGSECSEGSYLMHSDRRPSTPRAAKKTEDYEYKRKFSEGVVRFALDSETLNKRSDSGKWGTRDSEMRRESGKWGTSDNEIPSDRRESGKWGKSKQMIHVIDDITTCV